MMETAQDMPLFLAAPADPNVDRFLGLLRHYQRLTRRQMSAMTGWSERDIRALAEAAGDQVVRGQAGFTLTETADLVEIQHAAEAAISQGKKMIRYGVALRRRAHRRIG